MFLVMATVVVAFSPTVKKPDFSSQCSDGLFITVDAKFAGCVADSAQSPANMWTPPNGPAPMAEMKEYDDSWMDAQNASVD